MSNRSIVIAPPRPLWEPGARTGSTCHRLGVSGCSGS